MHLDGSFTIFQIIINRYSLSGQLAFLTDQYKRLMHIVSDRSTKDKSSGFRTCYYIKIQIFNQILHGINCKMKSVCIL